MHLFQKQFKLILKPYILVAAKQIIYFLTVLPDEIL